MIQIIMIVIATFAVQIFFGISSAQSSSRWEISSSPTIADEKEPVEVIDETPPAAAAPAPAAESPRPTYAAPSSKSDLPTGWEKPKEVPPGAVRLEDVKPGVTKPKPQQLDAPSGVSGPAPRPVPSAPFATTPSAGAKSDLPPGWEQPTPVPPGAVKLEEVKARETKTAPAPVEKAKPAKPEPQAAAEPEEPVDKSLGDSRTRPPVPLHKIETGPAPVTATVPPPAPYTPAPTTTGGHKSDLPAGWEQPTPVPPGAVRLEEVKPGTRPATEAGAAAAPAKQKAAPAKESAVEEEDVEPAGEEPGTQKKTRQRWGM